MTKKQFEKELENLETLYKRSDCGIERNAISDTIIKLLEKAVEQLNYHNIESGKSTRKLWDADDSGLTEGFSLELKDQIQYHKQESEYWLNLITKYQYFIDDMHMF